MEPTKPNFQMREVARLLIEQAEKQNRYIAALEVVVVGHMTGTVGHKAAMRRYRRLGINVPRGSDDG